jgi:hypothetical protein
VSGHDELAPEVIGRGSGLWHADRRAGTTGL